MKKVIINCLLFAFFILLAGCVKEKKVETDSESKRYIDSIMSIVDKTPDEYYYMDEDELRDALVEANERIEELEEKLISAQEYIDDARTKVRDAYDYIEDARITHNRYYLDDAESELDDADNSLNDLESEIN